MVHAKTCIMGTGIHPDGILLPIPTGPRALWWDDPQSRTRTQTCWGGGCGEEDCSGWTTATRCVFLQQKAGLRVPRPVPGSGLQASRHTASSAGRSPLLLPVFLALLKAPNPTFYLCPL